MNQPLPQLVINRNIAQHTDTRSRIFETLRKYHSNNNRHKNSHKHKNCENLFTESLLLYSKKSQQGSA